MSMRFGTSMMRRTRPRFLRTRKLDWTTDGIDFLRLSGAWGAHRAPATELHQTSYRADNMGTRGRDRSPAAVRWRSRVLSKRATRFLLELDRRTRLDELLLHLLGVGLGDSFLDDLGSCLDEVLRLLEAEARDLADRLDDGDLVATC